LLVWLDLWENLIKAIFYPDLYKAQCCFGFFFFGGAGVGTQGFIFSRQVVYHFSHASSLQGTVLRREGYGRGSQEETSIKICSDYGNF
jgi:hypothetical protein